MVKGLQPHEITWTVASDAYAEIRCLGKPLSEAEYTECRVAFQDLFTAYVNTNDCTRELGKTVSPCGSTESGRKLFKVRLGLPGRGKSGALRLAVAADCDEKRVKVLMVRERIDGLSEGDIAEAGSR